MRQRLDYYVGLRVDKTLDYRIMAAVECLGLTKTEWLKSLIISDLDKLDK
ncbi:hypothetical protein [Cetobacterium sp.]